MTTTTTLKHQSNPKNKEFTSSACKLSVLFFQKIFSFITLIYKFLWCAYQDYIFNRNYKRYLKYMDIYEIIEEDD